MEKERKLNWYSILYLICMSLLITGIPFSLFIEDEFTLFIIKCLQQICAIVYIYHYVKKNTLPKLLLEKNKIGRVLILLPLLILCFSNILTSLIGNYSLTKIDLIEVIFGIIGAVFVSIIEEVLFRGFLFEHLKKYHKINVAILLQAIFFGLTHILNLSSFTQIPMILVQIVYTSFLGIILGIIYYKTRNIIFPIIFHFLFNAINQTLSENLFNIKWDTTFFIVNILIGVLVITYSILISKGGKRNVTDDLDI